MYKKKTNKHYSLNQTKKKLKKDSHMNRLTDGLIDGLKCLTCHIKIQQKHEKYTSLFQKKRKNNKNKSCLHEKMFADKKRACLTI